MYSDISGYAPKWWTDITQGVIDYWEWIREGYKSVGQSHQEKLVLDLSYSKPIKILGPYSLKLSVSVVIDFEDEYIEMYPHVGLYTGYSKGWSGSIGVLVNYDVPGDYRGVFTYIEAAEYVGVGHCYTPGKYNNGAKSYYIDFSCGVTSGVDYYFWDDSFVFKWGE